MPLWMSIASNFDPALPARLERFNAEQQRAQVTRAFGSLPGDPVGGGRAAGWLPQIGLAQLRTHVAELAARKIEFAYTLNAPELFGARHDPAWRRDLRQHLLDLQEAGVQRLIVANHWLARTLRRDHPFSLTLSLIRGVSSPEEARQAEELGVDDLTLNGQRVNHDLGLVARIRAATSLTLGLNANMACLVDCPMAHEHYRMLGYKSRADKLTEAGQQIAVDPHVLECTSRTLADPSLLVRSTLIPPDYLPDYAEAGIDRFKFSDRVSSTNSLLRTLRAYASPDPGEELFHSVFKGGSKFKLGLRGLFPDDFVRDLPVPQLSINARRLRALRFIERQRSLSPAEARQQALSVISVQDPSYLARYATFVDAVKARVDGRYFVPAAELPGFAELRRLLA